MIVVKDVGTLFIDIAWALVTGIFSHYQLSITPRPTSSSGAHLVVREDTTFTFSGLYAGREYEIELMVSEQNVLQTVIQRTSE